MSNILMWILIFVGIVLIFIIAYKRIDKLIKVETCMALNEARRQADTLGLTTQISEDKDPKINVLGETSVFTMRYFPTEMMWIVDVRRNCPFEVFQIRTRDYMTAFDVIMKLTGKLKEESKY